MITACCKHQRRVGRPQTHTKNTMVQNLQLLFKNVPNTTIDRYGSLKDWINEASDEKYWTALVQCLLHSDAPLPERPPTWGPTPRHSTRVPPPPTDRDHVHPDAGQPATPPRRRPPPRQSQQSQPAEQPTTTPPVIDPKEWLNDPVLADKVG